MELYFDFKSNFITFNERKISSCIFVFQSEIIIKPTRKMITNSHIKK